MPRITRKATTKGHSRDVSGRVSVQTFWEAGGPLELEQGASDGPRGHSTTSSCECWQSPDWQARGYLSLPPSLQIDVFSFFVPFCFVFKGVTEKELRGEEGWQTVVKM